MCDYCQKRTINVGSRKRPKEKVLDTETWGDTSAETRIVGNTIHMNYNAYSCDSSFKDVVEIKFCPFCGCELDVP